MDIEWERVLIVTFILCLLAIPVLLIIDGSFDDGANIKCQIQDFDGGYRMGVAFGEEICWNTAQEEEFEYFKLE